MQLNKPKFWDKKIGVISIIIFPITLLYLAIIYFKKYFHELNHSRPQLFVLEISILVVLEKLRRLFF